MLVLMSSQVSAQKPTKPLRVATGFATPFVFEKNGQITGFSIDLWRSITDEMNVKSEIFVNPTTQDLLSAVKSGKADVGIGNISITAERDKDFDFSQPMFESGLQILVLNHENSVRSVPSLLAVIFSPALIQLVGIILVIILVPAHIVWFFERQRTEGMIPTLSYFPGIFKACWWAAATLATQADEMPKSVIGRVVAVVWMFTSVVFVAYFTATVTTSLTVDRLQGNIKGPDDLVSKRVATVINSTSATYLHEQNIQVLEFNKVAQAYDALLQEKADAVVFDAPVLLYYASGEGKGKVKVIGSVFRKENYGVVFGTNSPYRKPVNKALLTLQENGTYQKLYQKWFTTN
ncbi:MAG: transporter substrate-binding domain-containing protein [Nostoc sp.]|uniref:transporter substrate-binding domain-containing protein n=1 Tax=Nostoc sp. TaxID=1180 RepID=UPI002FF02AD6